MKKFLLIGPTFFLSLLLLVSLAGFFSAFDPYCELLSHLRLLNCLVATMLIAWLILLRSKKLLALSFLALLLNLLPVVSLNMPVNWLEPSSAHTSSHSSIEENSLKILQFNLWGGRNRQYKKVLQTIAKADPDVIGFSEITGGWYSALKIGLTNYPYSICETAGGGIAVFSKKPFKSKVIEYFGEKRRPRAVVEMEQAGKTLTLMCVHPVIPIRSYESRNAELALLAQEARQAGAKGPVVLFGDLNCSPWSYYFDKLLTEADLNDSEQGFGAQPSWCAWLIVPPIPIDHCLVSKEFKVVSRAVLPEVGSDHLPVLVNLNLSQI